MALTVASPTRMLPWTATWSPVRPPNQGKHSLPVKLAAPPCISTMPTWRFAESGSPAVSRSMTAWGDMPFANRSRPAGPKLVLAYDWVAIAPTPPRAQGTTAPADRNFDATATPHSPAKGSAATMLNVLQGITAGKPYGIMDTAISRPSPGGCP